MNFFLLRKSIRYFLFSHHRKGHGIHSPFIYSLIRNAFLQKIERKHCKPIEIRRNELLKNNSTIEINDLGAGSKTTQSNIRKISSIASNSLTSKKYCKLLLKLINHFQPQTILELGSSLGISTAYLAQNGASVIGIEGCSQIATIAEETCCSLSLSNVKIVNMPFDDALKSDEIKRMKFDFIFFDGNHTNEATLHYFNTCLQFASSKSVFVFDDIYWSEEMSQAWQQILQDERVSLSVDICKFGIVFFNEGVVKQHFKIRY